MKKIFFLLPLLALLFTSCNKDSDNGPSVQTGFAVGKAGSTWTYTSTGGPGYTLTLTDTDTAINGKTYKVVKSSNGNNEYRAQTGNDYWRFLKFPVIAENGIEELYLKADAGANTTWSLTNALNVNGLPATAILDYKIIGTGQTKTVLGTNYSNVTHVKLAIKVSQSFLQLEAGGGDFYYADGVGLIQYNLKIQNPISNPIETFLDETITLSSYSIVN